MMSALLYGAMIKGESDLALDNSAFLDSTFFSQRQTSTFLSPSAPDFSRQGSVKGKRLHLANLE